LKALVLRLRRLRLLYCDDDSVIEPILSRRDHRLPDGHAVRDDGDVATRRGLLDFYLGNVVVVPDDVNMSIRALNVALLLRWGLERFRNSSERPPAGRRHLLGMPPRPTGLGHGPGSSVKCGGRGYTGP
jgi:hypothetical protein